MPGFKSYKHQLAINTFVQWWTLRQILGGGGISGGIGLPICMVALQFLTHVIQLFIQLLFKGFQRLSRISWGWGDFGSGRVLDMVV